MGFEFVTILYATRLCVWVCEYGLNPSMRRYQAYPVANKAGSLQGRKTPSRRHGGVPREALVQFARVVSGHGASAPARPPRPVLAPARPVSSAALPVANAERWQRAHVKVLVCFVFHYPP